MRCRAIVDLDALRSNYRRLREVAGASVALVCVVKANAYGHGALAVSRALVSEGARHLAVASFEEAVQLRQGGVGVSVYVLSGLEPGQEREAAMRGIQPIVGSLGQLARWNETGRSLARKLSCHLLFNTGMNRLGIDFEPGAASTSSRFLQVLAAAEWVDLRGVATHYASAEDFTTRKVERQSRLFARQVRALRSAGFGIRHVHAANSAAIVYRGLGPDGDRNGQNMARSGLALYGYVKEPIGREVAVDPPLRPVLEWRARLAGTRRVSAGAELGYGVTFAASGPMRIGVVSVGYGDGFDWRLSNRGWVTLHGKRCPILGEVSMDLTIVDLTAAPEAQEGDEALILDSTSCCAPRMAALTGGTAYGVLCGITGRVPRQYVKSASGPQPA